MTSGSASLFTSLSLAAFVACGSGTAGAPRDTPRAGASAVAPAASAVGANPARRTDAPELTHATETLERAYALTPTPHVALLLALAYERVDAIAEARNLIGKIPRAGLSPSAEERLAGLRKVLDAREKGAPRTDDEVLDQRIIEAADRIAERARHEACCVQDTE